MSNNLVTFIAFQEQDNLGIGYIISVLKNNGFDVEIIDFRLGKHKIIEGIKCNTPLIIGFSVIFQYHIYEFKELIEELRENDVNCHFCAGGHYPSLKPDELFSIIPQLDSIVLFEGEYTFLNLVQNLNTEKPWQNIKGLSYKKNGDIVINDLRPLEINLDNFPYPARQPLKKYAFGKKYATLLAGRGCYYNCSFCSVRQFYATPPGPLKRIRKPELVIEEMEFLHHNLGCSIFMFQDDDFPIIGSKGRQWVTEFCKLLNKKGLGKKIMWKINCRADEIEKDIIKLMRQNGLFLVYIGIEDGTDYGLSYMNKQLPLKKNIEGIKILNSLDVLYDFGFMLFNPASTYSSILENLNFLNGICGDGSSPVTICKMLPYAGTQIEAELKNTGRLKGKPGFLTYDFNIESINHLYNYIDRQFNEWFGDHLGVLNTARWAKYYLYVYSKFYGETEEFMEIKNDIKQIISRSNIYFIKTMKELCTHFNDEYYTPKNQDKLYKYRLDINKNHLQFKYSLNNSIENLSKLAIQQQLSTAE